MRRNVIIAATVLIVGAGLTFWLWPSSTPADNAEAQPSKDEILAKRRAARRDGTADTRPARLSGKVVAQDGGSGIAGAVVSITERAFDGGARGRPGATPEPIVTISDERGGFEVDSLPPGRYSVSATARGFRPARVDPVDLSPGEQQSGLEIALGKGGHTVSGAVTDIGGGGVAGALVRAQPEFEGSIMAMFRAPFTTTTDANGRYEMQLGDGSYEMDVKHVDYVEAERSIEIRGGSRVVDFSLAPGGVIEGRVIARATDEAVAGAMVSRAMDQFAVSGFGLGAAVTDSDGRFMLRGLRSGAVQLSAIGRGFATAEPTTVELGIGEHVTDVVIYVDPAFTVSGFVVDKDDSSVPLSSVLVGAFNMNPGALHIATDPSAEDGYFEILGVKPGGYTVGAIGEQRVPTVFGPTIRVTDENIDDVLVELDGGITVSGRVEPPGHAKISLEIEKESMGLNFAPMIAAAMTQATADDEGRFTLRGLAKGAFTLVAKTDDGREGSTRLDIESEDISGLVVKLEDRAKVSGIVVDATGAPVAGARVNIKPKTDEPDFRFGPGMWRDRGALTQDDGTFSHIGLGSGEHTVSVAIKNQALAWAQPKDKESPAKPITIEIEGTRPISDLRLEVEARNQRITGVVVGPGGAPVPDAWVTARFIPPPDADPMKMAMEQARRARSGGDDDDEDEDEDGESRKSVTISVTAGGGGGKVESRTHDEEVEEEQDRMRRWYPQEQPVLTDADGRFEIKGLRDGKYDLEAEGLKGSARVYSRDVVAGTDVVLRLAPLSTMSGVVSKNGNPVTEYTLELSGPTDRRKRIANKDGRYELSRLDPGKYTINVTSADGRASAKLAVEANKAAKQNLDLVPYCTITGRVVNAQTDEPMKDYAVMAYAEGGDTSQMMNLFMGDGPKTDDEGRFKVDRLGAGKGMVMILDGDRNAMAPVATKEFELKPGQELDLGTLMGTEALTVPRDERGEYGMVVSSAKWKARPTSKPGEKSDPPSGIDDDTEYLWVSEVTEAGPAAEAGLVVGDRVAGIDGMDIDRIGPKMAQQFLAPIRTRAGDTKTLNIDRDGKRESVTLTAAPIENK